MCIEVASLPGTLSSIFRVVTRIQYSIANIHGRFTVEVLLVVFELCVELIYSGLYVNDTKLVHLVVCIHTLVFDGFYESMILYFGWFLEFYVGFRFVIL